MQLIQMVSCLVLGTWWVKWQIPLNISTESASESRDRALQVDQRKPTALGRQW